VGEIGAGDVLVHGLEEGLRTTRNGVVVVSPASMASAWVAEEYAAMLSRSGGGRPPPCDAIGVSFQRSGPPSAGEPTPGNERQRGESTSSLR
jgi:hypothetical protein